MTFSAPDIVLEPSMFVASRQVARCVAVATIAVAAVITPATVAGPAEVTGAASATVTIRGRGWGHGRGLGQYGSFGYAVDHGWDYRRILDHYYGGTSLGSTADRLLTVRLSQLSGPGLPSGTDYADTRVTTTGSMTVTDRAGVARLSTQARAVRVVRAGPSRMTVQTGAGCGGPWTTRLTVSSTEARVVPGSSADTPDAKLGICEPIGGTRIVSGQVRAVDTGSRHILVNAVPVEEYLRSVVPRESPASWGDAAGGKGMHALRAQAVAARSYALAERRSESDTCDTISCQVYGGRWYRDAGGRLTTLTDRRTDQAVQDTAGQVRVRGSQIARTEFSSSTGGWTAGGDFPAVRDDGDDTASNPNHTWTVDTTLEAIGSRLGIAGLRELTVTSRNGLGADGGRVLAVRAVGSTVTRTLTGDDLRRGLGLKSNWFTLSVVEGCLADAANPIGPFPNAGAFVDAQYRDFLSEEPGAFRDAHIRTTVCAPDGYASVLDTFHTSPRHLDQLAPTVRLYLAAFGRVPDHEGFTYWAGQTRSGRSTESTSRLFASSGEFRAIHDALDDSAYVDALYERILGRPADQSGHDHWTGRLESGSLTRAQVLTAFSESGEHRAQTASEVSVILAYEAMLRRQVDSSGYGYWTGRLDGSMPVAGLLTALFGTAEYESRH